jgi:uncharacterized protein YyaL (SSP411 family)
VPNRLAGSLSPYLEQHADNPVDWWPWCDEAFAEARRRDVPVLLSVGYAACHWCHVMAHESFEDPDTAGYLNEHFVCIKVDREERPDIDAVYMTAVTALTGQGGWPMTVVLTPDGQPFFAGTYFPPGDRGGLPSFRRVLAAVVEAWTDRRGELDRAASEITSRLVALGSVPAGGRAPEAADLDAAAHALLRESDPVAGGFAGAPKFPAPMCWEFLLRQHARSGAGEGLAEVRRSCAAMARGGIYDQLGGGFARYSVDGRWLVPHFEKMLYDNAQLLRLYAHLWRDTGDALARRVATETADFLLAELRLPGGGFAASLDADSPGGEGRFYVWSPQEVLAALGPQDGPPACRLLGVTEAGTFEAGRSVLTLAADPPDTGWWQHARATLLAARAGRPRPPRDDKVVAAWNGLVTAALADAGRLLDRADLVAAAVVAADYLVDVHLVAGRLRRVSRDGRAGPAAGVLEDYADVAEGLLVSHEATGERRFLDAAEELLGTATGAFGDGHGGFYDTAADADPLVHRPRDPADNATPSGASALAGALLRSAALTGSTAHRDRAEEALAGLAPLVERAPRFAGWTAAVAEARLAGPLEVAVVGRPDLAALAVRTPSPGAVVVTGGDSPLLDGRPPGAAYVCRSFVCAAPVTDPAELAAVLRLRPRPPEGSSPTGR